VHLEKFVVIEQICGSCGQELMPVVLSNGDIVDTCTKCDIWFL
jgi:hypothetical protein